MLTLGAVPRPQGQRLGRVIEEQNFHGGRPPLVWSCPRAWMAGSATRTPLTRTGKETVPDSIRSRVPV